MPEQPHGDTLRALGQASPLPRLEQHMLWQFVLNCPRSWLIAHDTDPLPAEAVHRYLQLQARRQAGEPMAYIVGSREFMGHEFHVTPAVLIPRPDTEVLVEAGLQAIAGIHAPRVLDLGTGSGAVAVSLALARPDARVFATDISTDALRVARENARRLGAQITFLQGSWYDVPAEIVDFDLIVSNPPYIHPSDTHLGQGDVRFEPMQALSDGADGLQALRTIVLQGYARLGPAGALFVEHGWQQAADVRALFQQAGFCQVHSIRDLAGIERVTGGFVSNLQASARTP